MTNIMDRMRRMEADMETRDLTIEALKVDMETKDLRISLLEDSMETKDQRITTLETQIKGKEVEMKRLRGRMKETEGTNLQLREMVDQVRNPPFAFQCAWQDDWSADNSIISYDRLTYDDISGGSIYNVTGGLDISSGIFTVGHGFSGVYTISYSIMSWQHNGSGYESNYVYLYLNGQQIEESEHYTANDNSEWVLSLGARTLHFRLEEGDQVTLRAGGIYVLWDITVCFQLAQFD